MNGRLFNWVKCLFFLPLFVFIFLLISPVICVNASDYGDFYYYGEICNSYFNMSDISVKEFIHPSNVFCFCYNYRDTQYVCVVVPSDSCSSSPDNSGTLGFYRHIIESDFSGNRVGYNSGVFYQVNYNSTVLIPYNGRDFYIRRATITDGVIYGCPYFSSFLDPAEGIPLAFKAYYDGVMAYSSKGGGSGGDGSSDLTNIENSLSDISASNNFISANTSDILTQMTGSSGSSGEDVVAIRTMVTLCFVILTATLFRNVFAQWLRNTVRR